MKYLLLFLLIFLNIVNAEIVFDDSLPPSKEVLMDYDSAPSDDGEQVSPKELEKNSQELLKDVDTLQEKEKPIKIYQNNNVFLNLQNPPKSAIQNQRVKIEIKATIARDDVKSIKLSFKDSKDYKIFNPKDDWQKVDENRYKKVIYVKYTSLTPQTPKLNVSVEFEKGFLNKASINLPSINVVQLASKELFSGVIADSMEIINHSEKVYDDKSNIVLLELNATNSNLDDFKIPYAKKSGIDEFKDSGESQKIFGFALIPNSLEIFKFNYFNPKSNRYELKSFNINLKDQSVSTQTDLNPTKNKFAFYKSMFLLGLGVLFLLLFLKSKSLLTLFFALFLLGFTAYLNIPMKTVLLKKGTGLKILPTFNSTVFYIVPKDTKANVAYEREGYYKVILENQKIGWVKNSEK